jgi:hypothetical protein
MLVVLGVGQALGMLASRGAPQFADAYVACALWSAGLWCIHRARKYRARTAALQDQIDPRPPVVYLRGFSSDKKTRRIAGESLLGIRQFVLGSHTEEEQMTGVLRGFGPPRAVADPKEKLPELGAARIWLPDDGWRAEVRQNIRAASLVVLRAGTSPGILDEADMAVENVPPEKLVILAPSERQYVAFRRIASCFFPKGLPVFDRAWAECGSVSGLIWFDDDWTPLTAAFPKPRWLSAAHFLSCGQPLWPRFASGFEPVFRRLAVAPPRMQVKWTLTVVRLIVWAGQAAGLAFVTWLVLGHLAGKW